ncbi:MAG TPA: FAD-dependent monooxygenase, partial [Burkholderiales bacterium]|nr:FAD-dependent monooxygenase [Burkholderiales bacterium]
RGGYSVALIEAREPVTFDASQGVGLRVSAISPGAQSILEHAGAWRIVTQRRHCAYRRMHVEEDDVTADGSERAAPAFDALEFAAAEFGMERLGTIVENDSIAAALWQVLEARKTAGDPLEIYCPARLDGIDPGADRVDVTLGSGEAISARLVVGADGPRSPVRELAGIEQKVWTYGQQGIVAVARAEKNNPGVAWQRFMPGGPLAFLPLDDGSSSIVWTRPNREAERLLGLEDDAFCAELEVASGRWLGAVESAGPRAAFDLTMRLSDRYAGRRTVLVGDAAHVVHPLAGQGVNMGFLDAAALVELLGAVRSETGDLGSESVVESVLERYQRWRRSDAEVMARGIHGIRALFAPAALAPLRRLGLKLVGQSWSAREAFLRRAAGLHADAPALARLL